MAGSIIQQLKSIPSLKIECPRCATEVSMKRVSLFSMYGNYPPAARRIIQRRREEASASLDDLTQRIDDFAQIAETRPRQIEMGAHASSFGKISEHILPAFLTFPYKREECRALFNPIDYVVFRGLCPDGKVENIKFVDVKTGNGRLTAEQKQIGDRVISGKVKHRVMEP